MTKEKVIDILTGIKNGTACLMPNMPEDGEKAIDIAIKAVEQSEPHWILCSDRLPEKDGRYIVSHRYLTSIVLGHPDQNVYEESVGVDSYHDGRFFYHDSAVAWWSVPVPEPYKGVTE